jgi:hypothetical protein
MEIFLAVPAALLALAGLAGCILPGLPGPPLNYISVILLQVAWSPFSNMFLLAWAVVTIGVSVLDYLLPAWISQKAGATRQGIIGSYLGLLAGLVFPPVGMVAGLILGAIAGDMAAGRPLHQAMRSGLANAFGTLMTTGLKLIVAGMLTYHVAAEVFARWY